MRREEVDNSGQETTAAKNKGLIMLLVFLVIVVVGLIVSIIVISINNGNNNNETATDSSEDESISKELPDLEEQDQFLKDVEGADEVYQISLRISDVYGAGNKDEALRMYDEELNKALAGQNYKLYLDLISTRSTMLFMDNNCEKIISFYDNLNINDLPKEQQITLYAMATADSAECKDTEKEQYWNNKLGEITEGMDFNDRRE